MKFYMPNGRSAGRAIRAFAAIAGSALMLALAAQSVDQAGTAADPEDLEEAVRSAAVACYAAEGSYPGSLGYLSMKYGIRMDPSYAVHYEVFSPNIMPEITVARKPSQEELWGIRP